MRVVVAAALTLAYVGCYSPEVQYGIPCAEDTHACPSGQECDLITNTCQPPLVMQTWRDDSAAQFATGAPVLVDATIEPNGAVGPIPYLTGRARLTGIDGDRIPADPSTASWTDVAGGTSTGHAFSDLNVDYGTAIPDGLGFATGDNITILVEGEIELDTAGVWRFELEANDRGFLEIAEPGTDSYTQVVSDVNTTTLGNYTVATVGWHKFRAAVSDAAMFMTFRIRYDGPGGSQALRDVQSDRLRARVDDLDGYLVDGFSELRLVRHQASTVVQSGLASTIDNDAFGMRIGSTWSLRWAGQMLIDTGGEYSFHLVAHEGARLWIDGASLGDNFGTTDTDLTTSPVMLEPGWHDVVVDLMKTGSEPGSISLDVATGPAHVGSPIDVVRPVLGRAVRFASSSSGAITTIPDGATASRSVTVDLPADMTPISVETAFGFDHPVNAQVSIALDPPSGNTIAQLDAGDATGAGASFSFRGVPAADAGATWTWIAGDSTVDAIVGDLTFTGVTIVCGGGTAPFPTAYRYESSVRQSSFVVSLGPVRWQLRQGEGAKVYYRTCDAMDACASEPWTEVQNGQAPAVPTRAYFQYAIDFTSDGDTPTALDWIEQDYYSRALAI